MARSRVSGLVALVASLASILDPGFAQHSGWVEGQVNATMCRWQQPRVAVVKDTAYIDGGYLWWSPGMASGEYGHPTQDNNPLGLVFTLNFSTPFNSSQNLSTIFGTLSKAPNGGNANNFAPNYFDGAMLANDHQWFLYGGLLTRSDALSTPPANDILGYQLTSYGVEKPGLRPGFIKDELPDGVTRYITFGGAVSVPSENLGYYFGGMIGNESQEIFTPAGYNYYNPTNHSDTLIMLNMTTQLQETWTNMTLPDNIKGRANPEVVWVPVGEKGILVVLGGVYYPEFAQGSHFSTNEAASKEASGDFMSVIDMYDIANNKWYKQPTVGGPTARTRGCAAVSPARDYSSLNIYWYGGYDGLDPTADFDDDVWILSLPSFTWVKLSSGNPSHGRAGHKCVMPYPDQMFVIGGYAKSEGGTVKCLEGGVVEILNLTNGRWMDSYHPEDYHDYGVPEMIHPVIGGDWSGGATMLSPTPTGWADTELASVFAIPYATERLTQNSPYVVVEPEDNSREQVSDSGGGWPSWATPVLVVLLVLLVVLISGLAWFVLRKRRLMAKRETAEGSSEDSGHRIISWIRGQPSEKAATVTTDETPASPVPLTQQSVSLHAAEDQQHQAVHYEMPGTIAAVEMMDTSPVPRHELANTGLSHTEVINKHTHFGAASGASGAPYGSLNDFSAYSQSGMSQTDHASVASNVSPVGGPAVAPPPPQPAYRTYSPILDIRHQKLSTEPLLPPSTPPLGVVSPPSSSAAGAGAGAGSTTAMGHVQNESVSTLAEGPTDRSGTPLQAPGHVPLNMLISPPQLGEGFWSGTGGAGRVSPSHLGGSPGPLRRSVFHENKEDLGMPGLEPVTGRK